MFVQKKSLSMSLTMSVGALLCCVFISQCEASLNCESEVRWERTGVISSRNATSRTYGSFCKYWSIKADANTTITISFDSLNIGTTWNHECTELNYLRIGPAKEHTYCGTNSSPYIAHVKREHVWVAFSTTDLHNNYFTLRYIVDYVPSLYQCRVNEFKCSNEKCIPNIWKCNGKDECGDNSDESASTCAIDEPPHARAGLDRIIYLPQNYVTLYGNASTDDVGITRYVWTQRSVGLSADMRGTLTPFLHVTNLEKGSYIFNLEVTDSAGQTSDDSVNVFVQEVTADMCGFGEWLCADRHKCIPKSMRCNGIHDCTDHSDEWGCSAASTTRGPALKECGGRYDRDFGSFTSPGFPAYYPNNVDCVWIITVAIGNKIQLRFGEFILQREQHTDFVAVYDGNTEQSHLLGRYYGNEKPPPVIESSANSLLVKFHSDGVLRSNGFTAAYQKKGVCMSDQFSCVDENECYTHRQRCDGVWNCPEHGADERGCGFCGKEAYSCGTGSKCYTEEERCNGKSFCISNADEKNCTSKRCGPHNGLFLCRNKRCIFESWECDRTNDCDDHSDEEGCPSPFFTRRVIVAAVAGSLICSLLLVIALGCICKVYALRMHEQYGPRHETPLSRLQAEFFRRRAPPPPYHEAMLTSRPYEEARREYLNQSRDQRRSRRSSDRRRNRPLPPTPEEPMMHQLSTDGSDNPEPGGSEDVQLISLSTTNHPSASNDSSSTTALIPPTTCSDSEEEEQYHNDACDDDDDSDSVLLDLTEGVEGTATWHSLSRHTSDEERSPEHVLSDEGCDSVDSASASLSVDEMSLALHESLDKENGVEAAIENKESSVDQGFPTSSTSVPEEQFNSLEHPLKNQ